MRIKRQRCLLWAVVAPIYFSTLLHAQSIPVHPEDEYKKLIRVNEDIQPLGENPFGENISLYNGSLSFDQTDISLAGTGPLLQLTRSLHIKESKESELIDGAFADWDIELPRITTMTANQQNVTGWQVAQAVDPNARCTSFNLPPTVRLQNGGSDWEPHSWWAGYQLVVPGQGSQDLLKRVPQNTLAPQMSGLSFSIITKQNWMVSCLPATDGSAPGEGFLAVAPDGSRYWFTHMIYRWAPNIERPIGSSPVGFSPTLYPQDMLRRREAALLVTRIEDRFGNSLTYGYSGTNLTSITASDGRQLIFTYLAKTQLISAATLQSASGVQRTWAYQYDVPGLSLLKVALPDSTAWSYNLSGFQGANMEPLGGTCSTTAQVSPGSWTGNMQHPAGLIGTFVIKAMVRGRSYVPRSCIGIGMDTPDSYAFIPRVYYQFSLVKKTFSGAGLPAQTWQYAYSPPNASWLQDCASGCLSTVWTDVMNPDGRDVRYTFSNRFDITEGQLQRTDFYSGAVGTNVVRSQINSYAAPDAGPWPSMYGDNLQGRMNLAIVEQQAPLNGRTLQQDNDTYTWQATGFNAYAQVTRTKRFSSIAGQGAVEELTSYLNDLPHWVLGLPLQMSNLSTGEMVDENVYDLSKVTLKERRHFGQKLMSYMFNAQGQLASFTDGSNHTTSLGNYKRGIPQTITTADAKSQTLMVDDFGQITRITDQAGSSTSYSYDLVGRLTQIAYPIGDEQAWLPQSFSYDFVNIVEYGLPAGHWRKTSSRGNARSITYFDALLRPVLGTNYIVGISDTYITQRTDYDWKGQKIFASYPVAGLPALSLITAGSSSTYDALGRLIKTQQVSELGMLTSRTAYLPGGRQEATDPKGNTTTTSYQVFDQPAYGAVTKVQAPGGLTQTITRDLYGNPLAIVQSGLYGTQSVGATKTLTYDSYHRLCRTTEPESGSEVIAYDNANNLAWSAAGINVTGTGCGQEQVATAARTARTYDAMNRLLTLLPPAGTQSATYGYDALGNLVSAVSGISTWTASRNKLGMLTGEALQLTGQSPWVIGYAHDVYGSLSLIHYPDGENVNYAPDPRGRPTQVGGYVSQVSTFPNGAIASFKYGNGAGYVASQNNRQLLSNFSVGTGSTLNLSEDFTYDADGNITSINDLTGGPRSKTFGYDGLNRLVQAQATGLWGTEAYTYDPLNNLRTRLSAGQTVTYNYDATNKLTSLTNGASTVGSYQHDNRGNVISKNGVALLFDQKNQLSQIAGYDSYAYDAFGRRVTKTPANGGAPTYYFYNHAGQLMYQHEPGGAKATNFIYLGTQLIGDDESVIMVAPGAVNFDANPNNGSYTVSWGAVPAATSYTVQESANGGGWVMVATVSSASAALSGRAGGSYVYRVQACSGAGCGGWTSSATLGVRPALPSVSVPGGTINGTYTVSWTAPASTTGYTVQESLNGGAWSTIASNTAATSISRPGTTSGSYTYQVSASNPYGSRGWAGSGAVTVDTTYGVLPTAPASLSVPASSNNGSATLSWNATSLTTRYAVEQSSNGGTSWTGIYNSSSTSTAVSGLADGSYSYHVQSCNTYGCSAWTNGGSTLVVTHPPTAAPNLSTPATSTNGSYTVSWTGVAGQVSYTLQEQINGGGWTTVQTNGMTSWSTAGRGNGTYGYHVQACNVGGCGPWSATASTTVLLPPPTPASISVPATSNGPIAISWAASVTATIYGLDQSLNGGAWAQVYANSAPSTTVTVGASGSYSYRAYACNASGCNGYATSSAVTVTIPPASAPGLSVPASSNNGSYTISWGGVSGATSYTLQEQINGGGWSTVQANGAGSWNTSGRGNGSYGYRVQACNAGGCGPWSGTGTISVALMLAAPNTPTLSTTGPSYKPIVKVSWVPVSGATRYEVEETHPLDGVLTLYNGPNTTVSELIYATGSVTFRVKACNAVGCSGWSGSASINLHSGL